MAKKAATQKRGSSSQPKSRHKGRTAAKKSKAIGMWLGELNTRRVKPLTGVVAKVDSKGMPYLTFKNLHAERTALQSNIGPKLTLEEFLKVSGES